MSRIFCLVGKSASGKDTVYKRILSSNFPKLIPVIPYTTRPMRMGESNGVDYNFVNEQQLMAYEEDNAVIEKRSYTTTQGIWHYFTLKFDLKPENDYILITTLDGALSMTEQYGSDTVHIVYLAVDDKIRLIRCIERESNQASPDYSEVCRRFIADEKDFCDTKMKKFKNIHYINTNLSIENCLKEWETIYKYEK